MDYSGHVPEPRLRALPRIHEEKSPLRQLIDDALVVNYDAAHEELLKFLIMNPGVVATFNQEFIVEMGPMAINDIPPTPEDRSLNEYRFGVVQPWRIRRRTKEDGPAPLGGDSGGEARTD